MANAMKIKLKWPNGDINKHNVAIVYVFISGYSAMPLQGGTNWFYNFGVSVI